VFLGDHYREGTRKRKDSECESDVGARRRFRSTGRKIAPAPTNGEETYSGPVFKRRRKATTETFKLFASDGCAPSQQAPQPSSPPPLDMVMVQEGEGTSTQEEGLWNPNLDAPFFLEKILLPTKTKEKLTGLEEDHMVKQAVRQLAQALATNYLAISKLREWKSSAKNMSHEVT